MEKVVARHPLKEQPKDATYWRTRPLAERLDAVETLRQAWWSSQSLAKDFNEFVGLLHAHGVEYLVVGG
jgi:hypothetical protein